LGRYAPARAAYERECQLATQYADEFSQVHCQLGLAALAVDTRAWAQAQTYLDKAVALLGPKIPPDSPPMRVRDVLQGRVDVAAGRLTEARAAYARALATSDASPTTFFAELATADAELAAGDPVQAVEHARRGLQWARSLQGNLPQSNQTGLAWLTLGRALKAHGEHTQAHDAFAAAVAQFSNTVDPDHPLLLQARQLLAAS
jgi:tetratricopeptide (TPR) repeat protein